MKGADKLNEKLSSKSSLGVVKTIFWKVNVSFYLNIIYLEKKRKSFCVFKIAFKSNLITFPQILEVNVHCTCTHIQLELLFMH